MNNRTIYLSGPMKDVPEFNYPLFNRVACHLRNYGWTVINPAENHDGKTDLPREEYFRTDIPQVAGASHIGMLPGWEKSEGARIEYEVAKVCGLAIRDIEISPNGFIFMWAHRPPTTPPPVDETILQEAQRLVHGDRGADYGHPIEDFTRTGKLWSAILGVEVGPRQVAICMALLKISRECNKPKRDNRVDAAGYMETLDMVEERLAA